MTRQRRERIVVDSCIWVSYLTNDDEVSAASTRSLLNQAEDLVHILVPSVVYLETLGTVRARTGSPSLREQAVAQAKEFFEAFEYKSLALGHHIVVASDRYMVDYDLKGIDAAIVATAVIEKADYLYTMDKQLLKIADDIPGLVVCTPPPPNTLPV